MAQVGLPLAEGTGQMKEEAPAGEATVQANKPPRQRLVGLDIFRGITMAVMLIVDMNGEAVPIIDHAPWNGIHLADFVMPFFLFISGIGVSISLRVAPGGSRAAPMRSVAVRAVKLFVLGVCVQGALIWHGDESSNGDPYVSFDLSTFRIMGILQRIALAFVVVAITELFVPSFESHRSQEALLPGAAAADPGIGLWLYKETALKWFVVLLFWVLQVVLTYGVRPPSSWTGCAPAASLVRCSVAESDCAQPDLTDEIQQLHQMGCSGIGWMDSHVLGAHHLYVKGKVGDGPITFGFDPEGFVASSGAVFTMYYGLHVGRAYRALKEPRRVLAHWMLLAIPSIAAGCALNVAVPFNKRLWSPSYNLFMCGAATVLYGLLFVLCDATQSAAARRMKLALAPLQWLGTNAILFYLFSDSAGVLTWLVTIVSWGQPHSQKNLIYWFQQTVLCDWFRLASGCKDGEPCAPVTLTYTAFELAFWMAVCGLLYRKGIFWKI